MNGLSKQLNDINLLLECPHCRETGFLKLKKCNRQAKSIGNTLKIFYLFGKYYQLLFKTSGLLKHLEKSNDYFDSIYVTATEANLSFILPKYQFKRAWIKHLIAEFLTEEDHKMQMWSLVLGICVEQLEQHPNNASFLFLKNEVENSIENQKRKK